MFQLLPNLGGIDASIFAIWLAVAMYFVRRYWMKRLLPSLALAFASVNVASIGLFERLQGDDVWLLFLKMSAAANGCFFLFTAIRVEISERNREH